jgi:hypothetical protein
MSLTMPVMAGALALAAWAGTAAAAADMDEPVAWTWVASTRHEQLAHQGPFLRGLVPLDAQRGEAALLASGRWMDTRFRLRAAAARTGSDTAGHRTGSTLRLLELARSFDFGEHGILTLGKTALNWDVGQSLQPVGFFDPPVDLLDGAAFEGRSAGMPLLALAWITGPQSLTLAYASQRVAADRPRVERWGLNAGWNGDSLSVALVLHKASGASAGLGGTLSWTASDQSVLHAAFSAAGRPRAVAGLTHALDAHNSWTIEIGHDGQALDAAAWAAWRNTMQTHRQRYLVQPDAPNRLALLDDIAQLGPLRAARRQLYLQWRHQQENGSVMPQLLAGSDGSVLINVTAGWRWGGHWAAEAAWTRLLGSAGSLAAQLPSRGSLRLSVKAGF